MVKLQYAKRAIKDLKNIYSFIALDSIFYAKNFIIYLRQRVAILKSHPEFGRPFYKNKYDDLRQVTYKSYRIVYHYQQNLITIITIHHQSKLPENIIELKSFEK